MITRATGYVRVSSEEQVAGLSLDAQRREIARYCEQRSYELVGFHADEGVSAYTDRMDKRPAFTALLDAAEAREFDVVVVHTLDRWARRSSVQAASLERLGKAGVGFVSVTEQIDYTTPAGRLLLATMGGVSEFFSAQLGVHVRKSKREGFERGRPAGGVPFGYRRNAGGQVVVDAGEADAVRSAFLRRDRGDSYAAIADALNAAGLRTRRGNAFTSFAVKDMLRTRFYLGVVSYRGEEREGHEPIVDRGLFEAVQQRRMARATAPRRPWVTQSLLAGRIGCARCGRPLWSDHTTAGAPLYREQHGRPCRTLGRSITAAVLDAQVGALFGALRLDDALLEEAVDALRPDVDGPSIDQLDGRIRRVGRAFADGAMSEAEYEGRLRDLRARRAALLAPAGHSGIGEAAALVRDLPRLWEAATADERRALIAEVVERVEVDIEERRIAAIVPVPAFDAMLSEAIATVETEQFRLDGREWVWWRRGRIELPVQ